MKEKQENELNETELVELCHHQGILVAHRGLGRARLVGLLERTIQEEECVPDPIDKERDLMLFIQRVHPSFLGQLSCSDEGHFCPTCPTGRVVTCAVVDNAPSLRRSMQTEMLLERTKQGT